MKTTSQPIRCVNLDWLEVFCLEPKGEPRDADYYASRGISVNVREYGTRVYNEMFTLLDDHQHPFLEVRRSPKSELIPVGSCHLRLVNAYCYHEHAANLMTQFINDYGYTFVRISRVDICLDFVKFDSGDDPQRFLMRYIRRKYSKINQSRATNHFEDTWTSRDTNSISWGAPSSDVSTKMYNKTLELYDPTTKTYRKPYIRVAWKECQMIDDWRNVTLGGELQQVWRVEFSIRSSVKRWFKIELNGNAKQYQSIHNTLDMYDTRPKLLTMFASLANHYFHFKKFKQGQRKDRCPDKVLFNFRGEQFFYKIDKALQIPDGKAERPMSTLLGKIKLYKETHNETQVRDACDVLIKTILNEQLAHETNLFTREERLAFQLALSWKSSGSDRTFQQLLKEVKELLKLNDNTIIF